MRCEKFTKSVQSTGPENIGPKRPLSGLPAPSVVNSPPRITLENNGKIRAWPTRENQFVKAGGGEDGIRTHEALLEPTPLAGERLRPLGHLSVPARIAGNPWGFKGKCRRGTKIIVRFHAGESGTLYERKGTCGTKSVRGNHRLFRLLPAFPDAFQSSRAQGAECMSVAIIRR